MGNKGSSSTSASSTTPTVPPTNESSTTLTSNASSSTATLVPKPATQPGAQAPANGPPPRDWDAAYGALAKSIGFGATAPTLPVKVKKVKKDSSQGGGESSGASRT